MSTAPDAQERFREVAEAYEVLSNEETRRLYDRYGDAGLRRGGFTPTSFDMGSLSDLFAAFFGDDLFGAPGRGRPARGGDLAVAVEVDLPRRRPASPRRSRSTSPSRARRAAATAPSRGHSPSGCPQCGGTGMLQQVSRSLFGEFVRTQQCPRCGGSGRIVETPCSACDGAGRTLERRALEIEVPPGIHDGQRIRMRGRGHAGAPGAPTGDVYVQVRVRPHEVLVRDGDDVIAPVRLTMAQAALGATLTVPTLEGETEVEFPPGTQPGDVHVLRGRGMPVLQGFRRGDQRLVVDVVVPRRLTDEQRALLEQLDSALDDEAYRPPDEGLFDRIKSAFR